MKSVFLFFLTVFLVLEIVPSNAFSADKPIKSKRKTGVKGLQKPLSPQVSVATPEAKAESKSMSSLQTIFRKNTATFAGLVDQNVAVNFLPRQDFSVEGARIIRANKLIAGGSFNLFSADAVEKSDARKDKVKIDNNPGIDFFAIYPTEIGLRIAAHYLTSEYKYKYSTASGFDATLKGKTQRMSISAAAAMENGIGAGVVLVQEKREVSLDIVFGSLEKDVQYGVALPQLYYDGGNFDAVLTWTPTMRHDPADSIGEENLYLEYALESMHPVLNVTHARDSEGSNPGHHDHFSMEIGARFMIDPSANIKALFVAEEAYYKRRQDANYGNVAGVGIRVLGEHTLQEHHVAGYNVLYFTRNGRGANTSGDTISKIDTSGYTVGASYTYRL